MDPVFIDFHIHTSDNPEKLDPNYDVKTLKDQIKAYTGGSSYLISLSDHNTINKQAYFKANAEGINLLVGVEIHVRNYDNAPPYHCHIIFDVNPVDSESLDDLNVKLDYLYPKKVVSKNDRSIPKLEQISNVFDKYEFLLLPHGGQNHATFDMSIPKGVEFDGTLERSIYYNHFDGFTARSNSSLEQTHEYFDRLGIKEFVNLVTATDNYVPRNYPDCKAGSDAAAFTPTWMLASPTFNGVRLSLSESSRLVYGDKPETWAECIKTVSLKNDFIEIEASLTPGLNVVIGGSSCGKSLFVDSIYRNITNDYSDSIYLDTQYCIDEIQVDNPAGQVPHYLDQNFISKICDPKDKENNINDISILKSVFPSDREERESIANGMAELGTHLNILIQSVKEIEVIEDSLRRIPSLSHLIVTDVIQGNPIKAILPNDKVLNTIAYGNARFERETKFLTDIDEFLEENPFVSHDPKLVRMLIDELNRALKASALEKAVREIVQQQEQEIDLAQESVDKEIATKRQDFEKLLDLIGKYKNCEARFKESIGQIAKFKILITTKEIQSMGHTLYISNKFALTKEKFLEVVNKFLKNKNRIEKFEEITPRALFKDKFAAQSPKVHGYDDFEDKVKTSFTAMNSKKYRIKTKEGNDFEDLSAGWKTSIVLDLILGWGEDHAPLIIDQPEDNLATTYINTGLLSAIKKCKSDKQIILVSHNATIPMLGDAQNIVMCRNKNNVITIRSSPLEGMIDGINVMDLIANTTDGGKASVKKRVKKYNLKSFRGGT